MKQAKEESAHQQNSNLVDALKNASNKTCLSQTNIEKSGRGGEVEFEVGGLLLECKCSISHLLLKKQRHHHQM